MSLIRKALRNFSLDTAVDNYMKNNPDTYITLDQETIHLLQQCLLEMLRDFHKFCEDNDLKYALTGGNVLGKVRHDGFIPWDDDVDILMPRKDYDRLKDVFYKSDLTKTYSLRGPGCLEGADYRCMKIYKKGTVMRPILPKKNGMNEIFIDVMPADNVPDNKVRERLISIHCNALIAILGCCEFKQNTNEILKKEMKKSGIRRVNYYVRSILGTLFLIVPLQTWYKKFDRASVYEKETRRVTVVNGKLLYDGEIVPRNIYMPFHPCEYEGVSTYMINNPKGYLRHRYGDYETIPDENHRETHCVEEMQI